MKIIYFSRDYTPHDHRFLAKMAEARHEIFYLRLEHSSQPYEDRPLPSGVNQLQWAGGAAPARLRDGPRLFRSLKKVLRQVKPDIILAGPVQRAAFLVALAGFHPLVTMSWGYDLLHDATRNTWWTWATRYTLQHSSAFVGDCNTIRKLAIRYGMAPERIVTFPWGVDIRHFTPLEGAALAPLRQRLGWGEDTFALLSTRTWAPLYGITDLARAFAHASAKLPALRLLMLGNGPQSTEIKTIFRRAGVLDRVHFPGQVSRARLPDYYRAADLYVSASHSDGTSISLLEALACGTPVLLTDIPGNREWVTHSGEAGWLFPEGNIPALEQAILNTAQNRSNLQGMRQSARQLAENRGDWEKNFPQLWEALEIARHQF